jgi:hypothetical protein
MPKKKRATIMQGYRGAVRYMERAARVPKNFFASRMKGWGTRDFKYSSLSLEEKRNIIEALERGFKKPISLRGPDAKLMEGAKKIPFVAAMDEEVLSYFSEHPNAVKNLKRMWEIEVDDVE